MFSGAIRGYYREAVEGQISRSDWFLNIRATIWSTCCVQGSPTSSEFYLQPTERTSTTSSQRRSGSDPNPL